MKYIFQCIIAQTQTWHPEKAFKAARFYYLYHFKGNLSFSEKKDNFLLYRRNMLKAKVELL